MGKCIKYTFLGNFIGLALGIAIIIPILYFCWPAAGTAAALAASSPVVTGLVVAISMSVITLSSTTGGIVTEHLCNKRKSRINIRSIIENCNDTSFLRLMLFLSDKDIQKQLSDNGIFETFVFENQTVNLIVPVKNNPISFTYQGVEYIINRNNEGSFEFEFDKDILSVKEFDNLIYNYSANDIYKSLIVSQDESNNNLYQSIIHILNQKSNFGAMIDCHMEKYYFGKTLKVPISDHTFKISVNINSENIPLKISFKNGNMSVLYKAKYSKHINVTNLINSIKGRVPTCIQLNPNYKEIILGEIQNLGFNMQELKFPLDFKIADVSCYLVHSDNHLYLYSKNMEDITSYLAAKNLDYQERNLNQRHHELQSLNRENFRKKLLESNLLDESNKEDVMRACENNIYVQVKYAKIINRMFEEAKNNFEYRSYIIEVSKEFVSKIYQCYRNHFNEELKNLVNSISNYPPQNIDDFRKFNKLFIERANIEIEKMTETYS